MTTNELLTLAISGIALLTSVLSLYLQFIHQRTALVGRLLRMHTTEGKWESQLTYSLSNTGNREILLSDVEFLEGVSDLGRAHDAYTVLPYNCLDSPCVLKPGEIRLLRVLLGTSRRGETRERKRFIMFEFTGSTGSVYELLHQVWPVAESPRENKDTKLWKPFTLKDCSK